MNRHAHVGDAESGFLAMKRARFPDALNLYEQISSTADTQGKFAIWNLVFRDFCYRFSFSKL